MQAIVEKFGDVGAMLKDMYAYDEKPEAENSPQSEQTPEANKTPQYPWIKNEGIMNMLAKVFSILPQDRPTTTELLAILKPLVEEELAIEVSV